MVMDRSEAGNELAELLWENRPALRRTTAVPHFFPPFTCSAAGTSRAPELAKHPASTAAMRGLLAVQDDDDGGVPWLHYPVIDGDDDCDTAPLPPEHCSGLLAGYADLSAPAPAAVASRDAGAPSMSHGAVVVPRPEPAAPMQLPRPSGEGVINFTFFSRPLQRPLPGGERAPAASNPVESTVVQTATNLLRSTPLFSEQRMAWLQPPPKESRTTVAAAPPPPSPAPLVPVRQVDTAVVLTHRLQSEARAPEPPPPPLPASATTSSVCSDNGDRSQLKRSSHHHVAEWSVSQDDEDLDDEAGALRRSAARSTKRGRTAEVHNTSERRRRDRINEKMRALQELIPNCNKIDKASMLEEAIEYLKTLQLQVQMMSTGTGLCVPPMLLPAAAAAAMQHLQMPPMAHFHHHHLGAMGLAGFGMAAAFDPHVQFACPMIPGAPPVFGVPGMGGHAMPSPASAPAAGAHVASVVVNNAAAQATAEQTMPSAGHPQVPAGPRAI